MSFTRPNIIIKDQELKKCLLIDMAVSAEQITRRVEFPVHWGQQKIPVRVGVSILLFLSVKLLNEAYMR